MTLKNITSGFKTTGIYPFNRSAVVPEEKFTEFSLDKSTGIKFIPMLCSPSRLYHSASPGLVTKNLDLPKMDPQIQMFQKYWDLWVQIFQNVHAIFRPPLDLQDKLEIFGPHT